MDLPKFEYLLKQSRLEAKGTENIGTETTLVESNNEIPVTVFANSKTPTSANNADQNVVVAAAAASSSVERRVDAEDEDWIEGELAGQGNFSNLRECYAVIFIPGFLQRTSAVLSTTLRNLNDVTTHPLKSVWTRMSLRKGDATSVRKPLSSTPFIPQMSSQRRKYKSSHRR